MRDRLSKIWNDPRRAPVLLGLIAFNAGVGVGYVLWGRKKPPAYNLVEQLEMKFSTDELKDLRDIANHTYGQKHPNTTPSLVIPSYTSSPSTRIDDGEVFIADKLKKKLEEGREVAQEIQDDLPEADGELVKRSIFVEADDWNYEVELTKRNTDQPYVIHKDEFYGQESGFPQITLTYYAGDAILVDEDDSPIYNHEQITGELLFGHGSGDPNVVHIRNPKRQAEYEVLHDPGLYSVEVLGLEIENNQRVKDLKHSRVPKFRDSRQE